MDTTKILLYGGLAFAAYELLLKPKTPALSNTFVPAPAYTGTAGTSFAAPGNPLALITAAAPTLIPIVSKLFNGSGATAAQSAAAQQQQAQANTAVESQIFTNPFTPAPAPSTPSFLKQTFNPLPTPDYSGGTAFNPIPNEITDYASSGDTSGLYSFESGLYDAGMGHMIAGMIMEEF